MTTSSPLRVLTITALVTVALVGCVIPAEPSRPFYDGDDLRLALGASLELRSDVPGAFEIHTSGVVDVVSQGERELIVRGLEPGETEMTFTSAEGSYVETARLTVVPAVSVELDPIAPFLAGTSSHAGVRLRDADGGALRGAGLSRIVDAPVGTTLSAESSNDQLTLAPTEPGTYRVAVAVEELVAEQDFELVSIHDADLAIDAPDVSGTHERWFTLTVTHDGRTLQTFQPEIAWTLDGAEVGDGAVDGAFPAELCVSILGRTECAWIE